MESSIRVQRILNIIGLAVIAGVFGYLLLPGFTNIAELEIELSPDSLPPDGTSTAVVRVRTVNAFGFEVSGGRAHFTISEGGQSADITARSARSATVRAGRVAGLVHIRITMDGVVLPQEVVLRVGDLYAGGLALSVFRARVR